MRLAILSFLMLPALLSCDIAVETSPISLSRGTSVSRLLFYLHTRSVNPSDIEFTISGMALSSGRSASTDIDIKPVNVNALDTREGQLFIGEAFVPPGRYEELTVKLSKARKNGGDTQSASEARVPVLLQVSGGQSTVVTVEWDTENSFDKNGAFYPAFRAERQSPSARDLLLCVSNSGSNYISIADIESERVIAAVTVGNAPTGLAYNARKGILYVLNSGDGTISEVEPFHLTVRNTSFLAAGVGGEDMAYVPDSATSDEGKLYVINRRSNDVTVFSTFSRRVVKNIRVGQGPSHVAASAQRKEVYVTNELSNDLSVINAISDDITGTIRVGSAPTGVVTGGEDNIYVMNSGSSSMSVVSLPLRQVADTIMFPSPPARGLKGFSGKLFVASPSGGVLSFFSSDNVLSRVEKSGVRPMGMAVNENRSRLYIADSGAGKLMIFNPVTEMKVKELTVGAKPYAVASIE